MGSGAFKEVSFAPGAVLFNEGDEADYAYLIRSGQVKITKKGPSGSQVVIAHVEKGGIVGEMAIVSNEARSASVSATSAVVALSITKQAFDKRLESLDPFLHSLIKTVIARLRKTSDQTVSLFERVKIYEQGKPLSSPSKATKSNPATHKKNAKASFANVNFMLADPNPQTRNSLRSGFFGLGFRDICDASSLNKIYEQLETTSFDLMILDSAFGISDVCQLVQDIRLGQACQNPFMTIMILSHDTSEQNFNSLLNCGCDTVLRKPLSIDNITKAVSNLCQKNRDFIVTRNYVGPDRTGFKTLNGENAPVFSAPNTLATKLLHNQSNNGALEQIEDGKNRFNEIKMERHLVQLAWLMERLHAQQDSPYDVNYILDCVDTSLEDLSDRAEHSRFSESSDTCDAMRKLICALREDEVLPERLEDMEQFYLELRQNIPLSSQGSSSTQPIL